MRKIKNWLCKIFSRKLDFTRAEWAHVGEVRERLGGVAEVKTDLRLIREGAVLRTLFFKRLSTGQVYDS